MKKTKRLESAMRFALVMSAVALGATGCTAATQDEATGASSDEIRATSSFTARGTGYFPDGSAMEGGFVDRAGKPLKTLQSFLAGNAAYVSVAMDATAFKYGTRLRIKELDAKYGRAIVFRVVDTGGAFRGKGRTRIDVCTASQKASLDPTINGTLHVDVIDETSSAADTPAANGSGSGATTPSDPPATTSGGGASAATPSGGASCTSDGQCNPGSDGSGLICTAGQCVPGCHQSNQCPGSTSCVSGQCR